MLVLFLEFFDILYHRVSLLFCLVGSRRGILAIVFGVGLALFLEVLVLFGNLSLFLFIGKRYSKR